MIRGKTIATLVAGILALGAGIWLSQSLLRPTVEPNLEIDGIYFPASQRRSIEDFTLTHHTQRPFTREDLKGKWTFMYFGYTYCPDVCPTSLIHLNTLAEGLAERDIQNTAFILISVDPNRDTPERLGSYVTYFNDRFEGATGSEQELTKLTKQFGVYYRIPQQPRADNYTVDHSSTVVLSDPDGRLQAIFTHPDRPNELLDDFIRIYDRYYQS